MKRAGSPVIRTVALMVGITVLAAAVTALTGTTGTAKHGKVIVTTVYPLTVAVENITDGVSGITVENLTGSAVGCLHDYQLSPANRITLQQADWIVCNGAGAETFLEDILSDLDAVVIDTDEGIDLLEGHEHHHGDEDEDGDDGHHHEGANEHLWTSPHRYAQQVQTVIEALSRQDPANRAAYEENGRRYLEQIRAVEARVQALANQSAGVNCILFHDSLAYLAADLGWTVAAALPVGEESGVSAGDLAAAQQVLEQHPDAFLLYDSQYTVRFPGLDAAAQPERVLMVDTAVRGNGRRTDWLDAMNENLTKLEKVIG